MAKSDAEFAVTNALFTIESQLLQEQIDLFRLAVHVRSVTYRTRLLLDTTGHFFEVFTALSESVCDQSEAVAFTCSVLDRFHFQHLETLEQYASLNFNMEVSYPELDRWLGLAEKFYDLTDESQRRSAIQRIADELLDHYATDKITSIAGFVQLLFDRDVDIPSVEEILLSAQRQNSTTGEYAYKIGMREGYVYITSKKLVLMGPPCVGKTAFKHLLLNWEAPKVHHSTPVASRPIRAMERMTDSNDGKVWDIVRSEEVFSMLIDAIKAKVEDPTLSSGNQLPEFESALPSVPMPFDHAKSSQVPHLVDYVHKPTDYTTSQPRPVVSTPRSKPISPTHDYTKELIGLLDQQGKVQKKSSKLHNATWIHVLDSGGQPQFADMSRAFLRGNALNVIVIKLTEKLSDKPHFTYSLNGRIINAPSELAMTNIQLIEHFVRSVAASKSTTVRIGGKKVVTKPFFIVIGTYFDQATAGFFTKTEITSETIADKNRQLLSALCEFRDHFIFYNDVSDELIFPVDNLCRFNRKRISAQIRERIMAQKGVGFQVPIPIRWYMFELHIKDLGSKEDNGIISLQSCYDVSKKLNMKQSEVKASLKYLDSLTSCLYYDKLLPNVIFTNPQYLLDLLSSLVQVSFVTVLDAILPRGQSLSPDTLKSLKEDGVFEVSFLDILNLPFVHSLFTKEDFLKLLQYLHVIAPLTSSDSVQRYYIPLVLPPDQLHLTKDDKQVFMSTCDPVIIEFKMKVVPQGIFPAILVSLVSRKNSPRFFADSRSPTFPRQLRYAVKLYSDDLHGSVLLLDRLKYIEVYFTGFPTSCPVLRDAIQEAIVSCGQLLGYDEIQLKTTVALSCQRVHRLTSTVHAVKVFPHNSQLCGSCTSETELPPLPLTKKQLCWLSTTHAIPLPPAEPHKESHSLPSGILNEEHAPIILSLLDGVDEWESLGIYLGLQNFVLQAIKINNYFQTPTCRKDMIMQWLQSNTATCQILVSALRELGRNDIVASLLDQERGSKVDRALLDTIKDSDEPVQFDVLEVDMKSQLFSVSTDSSTVSHIRHNSKSTSEQEDQPVVEHRAGLRERLEAKNSQRSEEREPPPQSQRSEEREPPSQSQQSEEREPPSQSQQSEEREPPPNTQQSKEREPSPNSKQSEEREPPLKQNKSSKTSWIWLTLLVAAAGCVGGLFIYRYYASWIWLTSLAAAAGCVGGLFIYKDYDSLPQVRYTQRETDKDHQTSVHSSYYSSGSTIKFLKDELELPQMEEVKQALRDSYFDTTKWRSVGLSLGLYDNRLRAIERDSHDVDECLEGCLRAWFGKNDNVKDKGGVTWSSLARALRANSLIAVAESIEEKYLVNTLD